MGSGGSGDCMSQVDHLEQGADHTWSIQVYHLGEQGAGADISALSRLGKRISHDREVLEHLSKKLNLISLSLNQSFTQMVVSVIKVAQILRKSSSIFNQKWRGRNQIKSSKHCSKTCSEGFFVDHHCTKQKCKLMLN